MTLAAGMNGQCTSRVGVCRAGRRTLVTLFLVLAAVLQIASPQAAIHVVWRAAVLSFDNPATQILDQIALEKPSFTDGFREAARISRLAATAPCGIALPRPTPLARPGVQGHFGARSPPLA